jgi:hypothetical protein
MLHPTHPQTREKMETKSKTSVGIRTKTRVRTKTGIRTKMAIIGFVMKNLSLLLARMK